MWLPLSAGLPPHESEDEIPAGKPPSLSGSGVTKLTSQSQIGKQRSKAVPVSFDDYHSLWKGIATSVTSYNQQDDCKSVATVLRRFFSEVR